jgi:hypothetical protein
MITPIPRIITYDPGPPPGPLLRALAEHIAVELHDVNGNSQLIKEAIRLAHEAESMPSRYVTMANRKAEEILCINAMIEVIDREARKSGLRFGAGPSQGYYQYKRMNE